MSDDLVERLEQWPMREKVETYKREFQIAETGNSYTSTHAIPVSPKAIMRQAAAEIRSLREQLWEVRCVCRTWDHPLADKIMALIEAQQDKTT